MQRSSQAQQQQAGSSAPEVVRAEFVGFAPSSSSRSRPGAPRRSASSSFLHSRDPSPAHHVDLLQDASVEPPHPSSAASMVTSAFLGSPEARPLTVDTFASGHATASGESATTASTSGRCNLIGACVSVLTAAQKLATANGLHFFVNHPLTIAGPRHGSTAAAQQGAGGSGGPEAQERQELMPRPNRPLMVALSAAQVQRILGNVLDIVLQCTPAGGQVCVTARREAGGVQLVVLHTGRIQSERLHPASQQLQPPSRPPRSGGLPAAGLGLGAQRSGPPGGAAAAGAPGGGLLSLTLAQQLVREVRGHASFFYPVNIMNAFTGALDVGTCLEIWLPCPAADDADVTGGSGDGLAVSVEALPAGGL